MKTEPIYRWDVVNALLPTTRPRRFLEIGVQHGKCSAKVQAELKVGVDPEPLGGSQRFYSKVHREPSDAFFAGLPPGERFDVILVDGLHHADQVLRDVDNALRHVADDGFIVMHDCNPQSELAQRVPRQVRVWNGDCWRAMVWLRQRAGLDAFTIDADHGVGVVRKADVNSPCLLQGTPEPLDYNALRMDRVRLLGLVSPDRWRERLSV